MAPENAQVELGDHALWSSVRALQEREILLRRLARVAQATGDTVQAEAGQRQADRVRAQAQVLNRLVEGEINTDELHEDSDAAGTGERGSVTASDPREGGDILPDRVVHSPDGEGLPEEDLESEEFTDLDVEVDEDESDDDRAGR